MYFDDYCYLCSNTIRFLYWIDRGRNLQYLDLNSEEKAELFMKASPNILNSDSIIVYRNHQFFDKSSAIFQIIRTLGGFFKIFLIFEIIPKKYLDFIYDQIAKRRYELFGKRNNYYFPPKKKLRIHSTLIPEVILPLLISKTES